MPDTRIPQLTSTPRSAIFDWSTALQQGLFFCLDELLENLVQVSDGPRMFGGEEFAEIVKVIGIFSKKQGDKLYELAFEVLRKISHTSAEQRKFVTVYG